MLRCKLDAQCHIMAGSLYNNYSVMQNQTLHGNLESTPIITVRRVATYRHHDVQYFTDAENSPVLSRKLGSVVCS